MVILVNQDRCWPLNVPVRIFHQKQNVVAIITIRIVFFLSSQLSSQINLSTRYPSKKTTETNLTNILIFSFLSSSLLFEHVQEPGHI